MRWLLAGLFDIPLAHPKLLAAMRHVLGDSIALSSLNFRAATPGHGHQSFHTDCERAYLPPCGILHQTENHSITHASAGGENDGALHSPPEFQVCNSIWFLDDFTEHNGRSAHQQPTEDHQI